MEQNDLTEEIKKVNRTAASILSFYKLFLDAISSKLKGIGVKVSASEISELFLGTEFHIDKSVFSKAKKWANGDERQSILRLSTLNARIDALSLIFSNDLKIEAALAEIRKVYVISPVDQHFNWQSKPINDALVCLKARLSSTTDLPSQLSFRPSTGNFGFAGRAPNNLLIIDDLELIGRESEIEKISSLLSEAQRPVRLAISGEPGLGKTSLAKFVLKRSTYHVVKWFVDASDLPRLHAGLRSLANEFGVATANNMAAESGGGDQPPAFLFELHKRIGEIGNTPILILFDNLDQQKLWNEFKTSALNFVDYPYVDILATTQVNNEEGASLDIFPLLPIDRNSSLQWLGIDRLDPKYADNEPQYDAAIYALGGRPLLLNLAKSLLRTDFEICDLIELLNKNGDSLLEDGSHEALGVTRVFDSALLRAEEKCPGSKQLLFALAFLAPEPIPSSLVPPGNQATAQRRAMRSRQITALNAGALLERDTSDGLNYVSVHRTTGLIARQLALTSGSVSVAFTAALDAIFDDVPDRVTMLHDDGRKKMTIFSGHISALRQHALHYSDTLSSNEARQKIALLNFHAAFFHRINSDWDEALASIRFACDWIDLETDPVCAALILITAANIYRQAGNFADAERAAATAIPILQTSAPETDYAWGLTVQARILRNKPDGNVGAAAKLIDQALDVLDSPNVAAVSLNLRQKSEALCYRSVLQRQLGELEEAEKSANMGLDLIIPKNDFQSLLSGDSVSDDPLVARHLRALGGIWRLQGRFEGAITAQQAAVIAFERIYGPSSSDVGRALDTLGRAQREWGDFDKAERSFVTSEEIIINGFGKDHANRATSLVNRAIIRLEKGAGQEAFALTLAAFRIYSKAYSEAKEIESFVNESTIWCKFVEADALSLISDHSQALDLHIRILNWRRNKLGSDHPHIASSSLAIARQARLLKVESVLGQSLEKYINAARSIRAKKFQLSPNIWNIEVDVEQAMQNGDYNLMKSALQSYKLIVKNDHPRIINLEKILLDNAP
jgi:tetratricopeptide (TPR) repeat protein